MKVIKFGGTSVGTCDARDKTLQIIQKSYETSSRLAVVLSAFSGVTDELILISQQAENNDQEFIERLKRLKERHEIAMKDLMPLKLIHEQQLDFFFKELQDLLHGVFLIRELTLRTLDLIMSFGERLSTFIMCEALKQSIPSAVFIDARQFIKTNRNFGNALVNYPLTEANLHHLFNQEPQLLLITGFIASTEMDETTTLGRGGSDFTAAIIGAALEAAEIEIWTDVDGVMTADPRKVKQAFPIYQMSYKEALEMSHFGAKVLHPPTIAPALKKKIPIRIKNTFQPNKPGTLISKEESPLAGKTPVCGISCIDNLALLRLEGGGLIGVCGIAMRLFGVLAKANISIILISQGSSEHSICFAIQPHYTLQAREAIEKEFHLEMQLNLVDPVVIEENLSAIAVVGGGMRKTPGIAGRLFSSLGKNGINLVAIVQGSSEYNITSVIKKDDLIKALNVIHEEFFLSPFTTLHLFLVGTGLIGKTLLNQMNKQLENLKKLHRLNVLLIGIADSKKMFFNPDGIPIKTWESGLNSCDEKMEIETYVKKMKKMNLLNSVFVDCTSSEQIAAIYPQILQANICIATPNKKANSGTYASYQNLREFSRRNRIKFLFETNVGAGLPIISTINDLMQSGDRIIKIEAILSGTISYLFNSIGPETTFSQALLDAQKKGYTEPDPREDLNGQDIMRKLLILARESGYPLEMNEIALEPLLPTAFFALEGLENFYKKLEIQDVSFEQKRSLAQKQGKVLRYIALLEEGKGSISLQAIDSSHPFYYLSGTENIVAFTTERYFDIPLVIKGPGAGAEVTAGELFAEIIHIGLS